ncbi:MAG TPA: aminodeoxychorismate synthase component I [Pyrinomonadaceae bacterium]
MTTLDIAFDPDELISRILRTRSGLGLCVLDSCGDTRRGSQLMCAGVEPVDIIELSGPAGESLAVFDKILTSDLPSVFTLSYDLGRKLQDVGGPSTDEPDVFIARFENLIAYNYATGDLDLIGDKSGGEHLAKILLDETPGSERSDQVSSIARSNFTKKQYLDAIERIKEHIRRGDTYQTNLTQKIMVEARDGSGPAEVFCRLRQKNPSPFSAYIERPGSTVVSASPERFFRVEGRKIEASPIKGTRPRGKTAAEDAALRRELLTSEKDRAENTMIVDLMRNDLGRVCEYGSVAVRELCELQELPTLLHLVSTVEGTLRENVRPSDILRALFPCGSITGAPKIRTMQIIDELEPDSRGLSMGAIGIYIPEGLGIPSVLDLSVAIRTMVFRDGVATFNVGGGIVIDSDPAAEYDESLLKATALLDALGASLDEVSEREQFETNAV